MSPAIWAMFSVTGLALIGLVIGLHAQAAERREAAEKGERQQQEAERRRQQWEHL